MESLEQGGAEVTWWDDDNRRFFGPPYTAFMLINHTVVAYGGGKTLDQAVKNAGLKSLDLLEKKQIWTMML